MADNKLFFVGVKALIVDVDGRVLLLKADTSKFRSNTAAHWDVPGGRMQVGEDALTTLRREVVEETGVAEMGEPTFFTAVISPMEIPTSETEKAGLLLMVYTAIIPADSKIVLSDEHTAYRWVDRTEAAELLSFKYPAEFTSRLLV